MRQDTNIDVHHLTRVEGHGNIVVNVRNGVIEKCEWQVPEAPRFFEAMVRGRHYSEVARITSRICGICSVGHTLASVKATEAALGIEITPQTITWTCAHPTGVLAQVLSQGGRVLVRIHCGHLFDAKRRAFSAALDAILTLDSLRLPGGVFESWFFVKG